LRVRRSEDGRNAIRQGGLPTGRGTDLRDPFVRGGFEPNIRVAGSKRAEYQNTVGLESLDTALRNPFPGAFPSDDHDGDGLMGHAAQKRVIASRPPGAGERRRVQNIDPRPRRIARRRDRPGGTVDADAGETGVGVAGSVIPADVSRGREQEIIANVGKEAAAIAGMNFATAKGQARGEVRRVICGKESLVLADDHEA
jgi:hypothetical protein